MQIKAIKAAYRRYAPVYDVLFGPVFYPGRRMILQALACRPGGLHARHPAVRAAEKAISPLAHGVGFHADLDLDGFIAAVGLPLHESRRANLLGGWRVLRFRNPERQSQSQERPQ